MHLIVISNPVAVPNEAALVNTMFDAGLKLFHLRKPCDSLSDVRRLVQHIKPVYYSRIALHQYHEMAEEFGMKRLHFKEESKPLNGHRSLLRTKGYTLSKSVHDLSDLHSLKEFDYVFFSPVFDSISKSNYKTVIGQDFKLDKSIATDVIALGGINRQNINQAKTMGFAGAAVLGALWNDPQNALKNLIELLRETDEGNR
jgi:thiamine-phosphate pyrophosphorylase